MAQRESRRSRVLVVAAGLFLVLIGLWLRIGWLQVVRHGYYEARAERNQERRVIVRPVRGQLLDRHGRPLARDLVTYSISAAPGEMKDPRATARGLAKLLGLDARSLIREFASRPRFLWVQRRLPPELGERVADREYPGVYVSSETQREYVLGAAASEILGRTNLDNAGVEGLELQLDEELQGRAGWTTRYRDGRGRSYDLSRGMRREVQDGNHVVLTLDAALQSIVETHLARAVDTLKAVRGFALFLDPRTGEVLAAVNVPHLPPGRARNWNFSDQIEPGSTFKIVVAGAALEEGVAKLDQWFEASADGAARITPDAVFHDVHKEAGFTFRDAVRWSSNIVMGKLGLLVGAEKLYRYCTALGFGSVTGLSFPGEAGGKLRSPARWSQRSCPTIAIGHEISVTPLQLALAYGSIANGGVLMRPMLVREIRNAQGESNRRFSPSASRRVFSERTARMLRDVLTAVVDSGTAKAARVPSLRVAGKTGTAQKYDAAVNTYGRGKYLSSFAGFVPADNPSLVGVVVIDEPRGRRYYGGEVAAPVFRRVIEDLRCLPQDPLGVGTSQVAARPPEPAPVTVPDLKLLPRPGVERGLAERGLRVRFEGEGVRALAQDPPAGRAVEKGARVTVWMSSPADSGDRKLPDLTGLPLREALRRLARLEVRVRIEGAGVVVRQSPEAGREVPVGGACRLWCEAAIVPVKIAPGRPASGTGSGDAMTLVAGPARNREP